ncbi:MAG: hypothetical protein WA151_18580 [Desulfatirhabdiaceae bacterium]
MKQVAAFLSIWIVTAGLFFSACESRNGWEGRYVSGETTASSPGISLTLQADGKGLWMVDQESTPIRWEKRQGDLWLHIRTGGVLIGKIQPDPDTIAVGLPGGGSVLLTKTSNSKPHTEKKP